MNCSRRTLLGYLFGSIAIGGLFRPTQAASETPLAVPPISMANIFATSFYAVREAWLRDQPTLPDKYWTFRSLGIVVESATGDQYPVEELATPVMWSRADNTRPINEKITLTKTLLTNAFISHQHLLEQRVLNGPSRLVVSKEFYLNRGEIFHEYEANPFFRIYTAFAEVPRTS